MDTREELVKLNNCVEDYLTPQGKHKMLVEAMVLIEVNRDYLENEITGEDGNKPIDFKLLLTHMENEFAEMKDYNHRVFPDWMEEVYLCEIKEVNNGQV